nr:hypothetical protein [Rhodococcus wratislaviensis]
MPIPGHRFEQQALEIIRATTQLHRPTLMHTLAEVPVWHDERVVLVGDAAHPVEAGQAPPWPSKTPSSWPGHSPRPTRPEKVSPNTTGSAH